MKEIRKQYKDNKDIDFVFITSSIESPKRTYDKFISEQEMINTYRLNQDDFNYLRQLFNFNGIPQYIVLNKNGDVIDDDYAMHNFSYSVDDIIANNK